MRRSGQDATASSTEIGAQLPEVRVPPPGPVSRALAGRLASVESPGVDARREARARASKRDHGPIVYSRGQGANVFDADGNRYVDLAAGFGALVFGHGPTDVTSAVDMQRERLWLALGDVYPSAAKVEACEKIAKLYPRPGARVLLGASGADAVTAALKTAVLATGRHGVVAFEGGYHGLSHGPLSACGFQPAFREPFAGQLNPHVTFAPYPNGGATLEATMTVVAGALAGAEVGAVLVEPILGRGGCIVPAQGFLGSLRAACDRAGALLIADEVWTGLGRSGAWLASVDEGVLADVVCLGKGLGAGIPISACVGSERVMAAWESHGGATLHTATHFGSPPACAAAAATLDGLANGRFPERARELGEQWLAELSSCAKGRGVSDVRGRGLMIGVAVEGGAGRALAVSRRLLEAGWIVLTGGAHGDVLTLTPPLNIAPRLLSAFAGALVRALDDP
jgi:4-aminobutyrate aminotransferase / (S)-3-amino-2-methylpropionate transaminase / 5-aminovalerate transaminase